MDAKSLARELRGRRINPASPEISDGQLQALQHYIRQRARETL
ncbi:MAG: hypothetical protein WBN23_02945 [Woeseia sp.]